MNSLSAIILAAGRAERMRAGCNKALLPLAGRSVLCYTLEMWRGLAARIVVAAAAGDYQEIGALIAPYGSLVQLVEGGSSRAASLARALSALPPSADEASELVAVHDAARPLTLPADLRRVVEAAERHGAAILAAPVTDTVRYRIETSSEDANLVRQNEAEGFCGALLPREQLLAAQTPQIFRRDWLVEAYAAADEAQLATITDDAALLQAHGHECAYVWAEGVNIKLTRPEDMMMAEAILAARLESPRRFAPPPFSKGGKSLR